MSPATGFYASLPHRFIGAGLLVTDAAGAVLLVKPTYKPQWEIPGGVVEVRETPPEACAREVGEELGLRITVGRLLAVEHQWHDGPGDSVMFVYDGGTAPVGAAFALPADELSEYAFVPRERLDDFTVPWLAGRIRAALDARESGGVAELENQVLRPVRFST